MLACVREKQRQPCDEPKSAKRHRWKMDNEENASAMSCVEGNCWKRRQMKMCARAVYSASDDGLYPPLFFCCCKTWVSENGVMTAACFLLWCISCAMCCLLFDGMTDGADAHGENSCPCIPELFLTLRPNLSSDRYI
jgi:hypothetical protein